MADIDIRLPQITGASEREQLAQVKSYLFQLAQQLQYALGAIGTSESSSPAAPQVVRQTVSTAPARPSLGVEATFDTLKPLIIKSAEIVEAYYEEINKKLTSVYVAQSDFGTYTEKTEKLVTETAAYREETYARFSNIETAFGELEKVTKGYIKSGIIVDSLSAEEAESYGKQTGDPLIGIEVGETTIDGSFTRYARFTANRLSFYDQQGYETAYISNYKLYISNVEIISSYKIGGFKDTVDTLTGDVVTKWVGRE